MKNLIKIQTLLLLISFAICILSSCTKDEIPTINNSEIEIPEGFKYAKVLKIQDDEGNIAVVQIAGNEEGKVNNFNKEDLVFKVSNERSALANSIQFNITEDGTLTEEGADDVTFVEATENSNTIFINIIKHQLNEDVVRFSVMPKNKNNSNTGASKTQTYYIYGITDGARGAEVEYHSEERRSCYIDIDLDKKDYDGQTFWNELWDERMGVPETSESFWQENFYYKLRLKINSQGWRCTNDDKVSFDAWFLP